MPNEFDAALSYFTPDPKALAEARKKRLKKADSYEQGYREGEQIRKEQERAAQEQLKEQERLDNERAKAEAQQADLARKQRLADTERAYAREGRPTRTDAMGEIFTVDDDETWQRKQAEKKVAEDLKAQSRADAAFRKAEAVRLNQQETKLKAGIDDFDTAEAIGSQAVSAKASEIISLSQAHKAASDDTLPPAQRTQITSTPDYQQWLASQPPESKDNPFAIGDYLATRIQSARKEKELLENSERTLKVAKLNKEQELKPELNAIQQKRDVLPITTAPAIPKGAGVTLQNTVSTATPTPASADPERAAAVLRTQITALREKGDFARADALEKRLVNPAKWEAEQKAFRQTATPEQLVQTVEAGRADITEQWQATEQVHSVLSAQRQAYYDRLDRAKAKNASLLEQPYSDGDVAAIQDETTGEVTRWHKAAAEEYNGALQGLQGWQQANQEKIDLLDLNRQQLQIEAANLDKHVNQLNYLGREQQRQKDGEQSAVLNQWRATPGMAEFADEVERRSAEFKQRQVEIERKYAPLAPPSADETTVREDPAEFARKNESRALQKAAALRALQEEAESADKDMQQRMQTTAEGINSLYADYGSTTAIDDWQTTERSPINLKKLAEDRGITEQEARTILDTGRKSDWRRPLPGDEKGVRKLPSGQLSVDPKLWLDPKDYEKAVNDSDATPEAKKAAISVRRDLAAPDAAAMLLDLQKVPEFAEYLAKTTSGTPVERMEQFQADLKAGGTLAASIQRMQGGTSSLASSALGAVAAVTGSDYFRGKAEEYQTRAQAFETAGAAGARGTNAVGNFTSKIAGAAPSLLGAMVPGGLAVRGAQAVNAFRLASSAARAAQMRQVVAGFKGAAGAYYGTAVADNLLAASHAAMMAAPALNRVALAGAALGSGAQSFGGTYIEAIQSFEKQGLSPTEAHGRALGAALLSGSVTTALTALSGLRGAESILAQKEIVKKTLVARAKEIGIGFADEALEEGVDQLAQGIIALHTYNPSKKIGDILSESLEAALIGGVLGGGMTALSETVDHMAGKQALLAEDLAAADAEITNYQDETADTTENDHRRNRASLAQAIARGVGLDGIEETILNSAGWTRKDKDGVTRADGTLTKIKDYTGPNVLDVDSSGKVKLDKTYVAKLAEVMPTVAGLVRPQQTTWHKPGQIEEPKAPVSQSPVSGAAVSPSSSISPAPATPAPSSTPSSGEVGKSTPAGTSQTRGTSAQGAAAVTDLDTAGKTQAAAPAVSGAAADSPVQITNVADLVKNGGGVVSVTENGRQVSFDKFAIAIDGVTAEIAFVELSAKERGKGLGKAAYIALGKALAAQGITLQSSKAQYKDGRALWQSLAKAGFATRGAQGVYTFTTPAKQSTSSIQPGQRVQLPNRSIYRGRMATVEKIDNAGFASVTTDDGEKMIVKLDEISPAPVSKSPAQPSPSLPVSPDSREAVSALLPNYTAGDPRPQRAWEIANHLEMAGLDRATANIVAANAIRFQGIVGKTVNEQVTSKEFNTFLDEQGATGDRSTREGTEPLKISQPTASQTKSSPAQAQASATAHADLKPHATPELQAQEQRLTDQGVRVITVETDADAEKAIGAPLKSKGKRGVTVIIDGKPVVVFIASAFRGKPAKGSAVIAEEFHHAAALLVLQNNPQLLAKALQEAANLANGSAIYSNWNSLTPTAKLIEAAAAYAAGTWNPDQSSPIRQLVDAIIDAIRKAFNLSAPDAAKAATTAIRQLADSASDLLATPSKSPAKPSAAAKPEPKGARPEYATLRDRLKSKDISTVDAVREVIRLSGETDTGVLQDLLTDHLGLKKPSAAAAVETLRAAGELKGDKNDDISIASSKRASDRQSKPSDKAYTAAKEFVPATQGAFAENPAWARAKLSMLARTPPARRRWAYRFLTHLENSIAPRLSLYDAIAVGETARKLLGGNKIAVTTHKGKITLAIDLDRMVRDFSYLGDPRAAATATAKHEDIHAAQKHLERAAKVRVAAGLDGGKWTHEALAQQWRDLPAALQKAVWEAYNNVQASNNQAMPTNWDDEAAYAMQSEFLRMLVEGSIDPKAITEAVDAAPDLLQRIKDLLADLYDTLRSLIKGLPVSQAVTLDQQVTELKVALEQLGKPSTAEELRTKLFLRDPSAVAMQALKNGTVFDQLATQDALFTPQGLRRVWDLLTPEMRAQVERLKKTAAPWLAKKRTDNAALTRDLLTFLLDPRAAEALAQANLTGSPAATASTGMVRRALKAMSDYFRSNRPDFAQTLGSLDLPTAQVLQQMQSLLVNARAQFEASAAVQKLPTLVTAEPQADDEDARQAARRMMPGVVDRIQRRLSLPPDRVGPPTAAELSAQAMVKTWLEAAVTEKAFFDAANAAAEEAMPGVSDAARQKMMERWQASQADNTRRQKIDEEWNALVQSIQERVARQFSPWKSARESAEAIEALIRQDIQQAWAAAILSTAAQGERRYYLRQQELTPVQIRQIESLLQVANGALALAVPYDQRAIGIAVDSGAPVRQMGLSRENALAVLGIRIGTDGTAYAAANAPVYIEGGTILIKQTTLDDLSQTLPITRRQFRLSEDEQRARIGLRGTPQPVTAAAVAEARAADQQQQDTSKATARLEQLEAQDRAAGKASEKPVPLIDPNADPKTGKLHRGERGDLISWLGDHGSLGWPDSQAGGEWDWFLDLLGDYYNPEVSATRTRKKALRDSKGNVIGIKDQAVQGTKLGMTNTAKKMAREGNLSTPAAIVEYLIQEGVVTPAIPTEDGSPRNLSLHENIGDRTGIDAIEEAALEANHNLPDGIGNAVMTALDGREAARTNRQNDPERAAELQTLRFERDTRSGPAVVPAHELAPLSDDGPTFITARSLDGDLIPLEVASYEWQPIDPESAEADDYLEGHPAWRQSLPVSESPRSVSPSQLERLVITLRGGTYYGQQQIPGDTLLRVEDAGNTGIGMDLGDGKGDFVTDEADAPDNGDGTGVVSPEGDPDNTEVSTNPALDSALADLEAALQEEFILPASLRTTPEQRRGELTGAEVDVQGTRVRTGSPVTFRFLHNKQSATKIWGKPKKDSDFDRGFEPSGRYVSEVTDPDYLLKNFPSQYEAGELTFENPIVIDGGTYGEPTSWKRRLSTLYGGTRGKRLSQAILADGYDGVITVSDRGNPSEILDLTTFNAGKALYASNRLASKEIASPLSEDQVSEFAHEKCHAFSAAVLKNRPAGEAFVAVTNEGEIPHSAVRLPHSSTFVDAESLYLDRETFDAAMKRKWPDVVSTRPAPESEILRMVPGDKSRSIRQAMAPSLLTVRYAEDYSPLASAPRLQALHNLSAENLIFADKMGGIAVPSMAVTPEGQGMSGFGNITLIGTRDLVDPAKEPVFDADAYSPRFPDPEFPKAKSKDAQKVVDDIRPFSKAFGDNSLTDSIWDNAVNRPRPGDTVEKMQRSDAAKAAFLASQGIQVKPVMKDTSLNYEVVREPAFQSFRENPQQWHQTNYNDSAAMQRLGTLVKDAELQKIDQLKAEPRIKDYLRKNAAEQLNEKGELLYGVWDRIGRDLKNLGTQTVDYDATRKVIAEAMQGKEAALKAWAEKLILPLHASPSLTLKGRKVPYTLDNIVQAMTGRVRGREDTMTFGEGTARAHISKRFKDLEQMRKAAGEQIVPEAEVSAARERAQKVLAQYREKVADYTTITNYRGNKDTFEAFDAAMRALVTWAKGKKDTATLARALRAEDFENVPDNVVQLGQRAAQLWLQAPVPYFEAKPQRAVRLDEFIGAVIPEGSPPEVTQILDKHGIRHRTYTGSTDVQTTEAAAFAQQLTAEGLPALFSAPRRAYQTMTFEPSFATPFGEIVSYHWMSKPIGGMEGQRVSDWSQARTNAITGRDIVHHFKVLKPDGIHTVSLETALGQLSDTQRKRLQGLIRAEQSRRQDQSTGQMALFSSQRSSLAMDEIKGRMNEARAEAEEDGQEFDIDAFIDRLDDGVLEEALPVLYSDFFGNPATTNTTVFHHTTDRETVDAIIADGLKPMKKTRGTANRGTGSAIFTFAEEDPMGSYGDYVVAIDLGAARNAVKGLETSLEDPVEEMLRKRAVAHALGGNEEGFEVSSSEGITEDTLVIRGGTIPPSALQITDKNGNVLHKGSEFSSQSLFSAPRLEESAIQGYLDLPDVAVPSAKQPAAKRTIRAAGDVKGAPYLPASGGDTAARGRLDALRERAQRAWRGLMNQDVDALKEAFTEKDSFSTLIHDFVSREIPSFDIRGAIIHGPDDFAAFNLAVRSPYFESLKIAVMDSAFQVVHSQLVHVGGLNEAVVDTKVIAGILATAKMLNPKAKLIGWMIAHNHPSGDPAPSDADKRVTKRLVAMGEMLGLPLMDHVVTNGQKYFSFRESGIIGSADIDRSIDELPKRSSKPKLPILPTPKDKPVSWGYPANPDGPMADWEAIPSGSSVEISMRPERALPYMQALRTADPDYYHVLYLDTRLAIRAVERLPTDLTTAQMFQRIVLGTAREGAYSYTLGFPATPTSEQKQITVEAATGRREGAEGDWIVRIDGQFESLWSSEAEAREWAASIPATSESKINEDSAHVPTDQQRRLVRRLREQSQTIGLQFTDAMTVSADNYFSFAEHGIMEEPALYASPKLRAAADTAARAARASGIVSYNDFRALIAAKLPQALTTLDPILPEVWDLSAQPRLALDLPEMAPTSPSEGRLPKSPTKSSPSLKVSQSQLPFQPRAPTIERTMSPLPPGADMTSLERAKADALQREQQALEEQFDTLEDELSAAADEALDAYQDDPELASSQRLPDIQTAVMIDGKPHTSGDDTHYFTTLDYIMRQLPAWQREDRSQALEKADTILTNDWLKQHNVEEGFLVDGKWMTRQQTLAHVRKLGLTTPLADTENRDWFDTTDLAELRAAPLSSSDRSSTNVNLGAQDSTQSVSPRSSLQLETGEAAALESFVNAPVRDAVALRQSLNGRSLLAKLNSLINRPAQTPKLVDLHMLPLGDDLQIVDGVVQSIPISVVNDLLGGELASKRFLYQQTVFEPLSSDTPNLDTQQTVGRGVSGKLTDVSKGAAHAPSMTPRQTEVNQRAEKAANETNTAPSEAQKQAGNYAKGKLNWNGLTISIENPRGSVRKGTDANGKAWEVTMPHHYGYILGTTGKDKDHLDIFLGPDLESPMVFVINQKKPGNGHFDEHKLMAGFTNPGTAARGYLDSYSPGWRGYDSIVPMTIPQLKHWLDNGKMGEAVTKAPVVSNDTKLTPETVADTIVTSDNLDGWLDTYMSDGWTEAEQEYPGGANAIARLLEKLPERQHDRALVRGINPRFGEVVGRPFYSYSFSPESARAQGSELATKKGPTKYLSADDITMARIRRDGKSHYSGMQSEVWVPASALSSSPRLPVSQSSAPLPASPRQILDATSRASFNHLDRWFTGALARQAKRVTSRHRVTAATHTFPDGYHLTGPGLHLLPASIRAYHGTPHDIDPKTGFSTSKIGTGEGAQVYGWGLYFAEAMKVAEQYRRTLSTPVLIIGDKEFTRREGADAFTEWAAKQLPKDWPPYAVSRFKEVLNRFHYDVTSFVAHPDEAADDARKVFEKFLRASEVSNDVLEQAMTALGNIVDYAEAPSPQDTTEGRWYARAIGWKPSIVRHSLAAGAFYDMFSRIGWYASTFQNAPSVLQTEYEQTIIAQNEELERLRSDPNAAQNKPQINAALDRIRIAETALGMLKDGRVKLLPNPRRGNFYTVDILGDPEQFLQWDEPLSKQSQFIRDAFTRRASLPMTDAQKKAFDNLRLNGDAEARQAKHDAVLKQREAWFVQTKAKNNSDYAWDWPAEDQRRLEQWNDQLLELDKDIRGAYQGFGELYRQFTADSNGTPKDTSEFLAGMGIKGVRYLDGSSRSSGQGTHNYVLFDDKLVRILEKNGQPIDTPALASSDKQPLPAAPDMDDYQTWGKDKAVRDSEWNRYRTDMAKWEAKVDAFASKQGNLGTFLAPLKSYPSGQAYREARTITRVPGDATRWRATIFGQQPITATSTPVGDWANNAWVPVAHNEFETKAEAYQSTANSMPEGYTFSSQPLFASNRTTLAAAPRFVEQASRASFNHLDRWFTGAIARQAKRVTSSDPVTAATQAASAWWNQDTPGVSTLRSLKELAQRELLPETVLPREIMSAMREMQIKQSMGQQKALDVGRALSDKPKFSDLHYPPEFVENPMHREAMFSAMEQGKVDTLPPALQEVAKKLRQMLVEAGREAVKQGRMNPDTFEGLRTNFMPRFTKEEAQASAGDFAKRFKLGVKDILAQRSTAFHITDTSRKDKNGLPQIVSHAKGKWRFDSQQARDAYYEDLINRQTLDGELAKNDMHWMNRGDARALRSITPEMLKAPATMTKDQRDVVARVQRQLRNQFKKEDPYEPKDLVKDPVYAVMRYLAQMTHDNAVAEFFNVIDTNPDWTSSTEMKGFTQIPDNDRFGALAGKYVRKDIADQVMELAHTPAQVIQLYDTLLRLWKTGKTVLNPATHARNILGNLPFAQFAGNNALNPANWPHYAHAFRTLRQGGDEYRQLYETGVLGADYASTELRAALENIVPVVQEDDSTSPIRHLIALGNRAAQWGKAHSLANVATLGSVGATAGFIAAGPLGALAGAGIAAAANPIYRGALWIYRLEDDLFKAAAFFKARSMGMNKEQAAQHVRDWFPYYDKPTSTTLKFAGRTTMPFLSFFRESARIGAKAAKERPLSLAATLAIPTIITALSQAALGLDDEDMEDVKSGMRGKGAKLLGMTPLAGVPIFSMLIPWRTSSGQLQQIDLSSTHPMADFLANRVENWNNDPWWQAWSRSALANPMLGALYTAATGRDPFGDRTLWDSSYSSDEKARAILGHAWKTAVPPLAPGGTNWTMIDQSTRRQANKTLALRSPAQAVARGVAGVDVRSADPDIYSLADAFRKRRGLPVTEGNTAYPTDAAGRARKALFEELVQPQPSPAALAKLLQSLNDLGKPVRTVADVLDILDYRRPDGVINPKELRAPFRASLAPEARRVLDTALKEFQRARAATPGAFAKARQQIKPTTRAPITEP